MTSGSLITEDLRNKIGIESEPEVCEIERGMIRRFVQAIDDPNPQWQRIAPPTFMPIIGFKQSQQILDSFSSETILHGNTELEYYQPVRAGDTISVTTKLANIRERRVGKVVFMTLERTYKNQRQQLVAKCRQTVIIYNNEEAKT